MIFARRDDFSLVGADGHKKSSASRCFVAGLQGTGSEGVKLLLTVGVSAFGNAGQPFFQCRLQCWAGQWLAQQGGIGRTGQNNGAIAISNKKAPPRWRGSDIQGEGKLTQRDGGKGNRSGYALCVENRQRKRYEGRGGDTSKNKFAHHQLRANHGSLEIGPVTGETAGRGAHPIAQKPAILCDQTEVAIRFKLVGKTFKVPAAFGLRTLNQRRCIGN